MVLLCEHRIWMTLVLWGSGDRSREEGCFTSAGAKGQGFLPFLLAHKALGTPR